MVALAERRSEIFLSGLAHFVQTAHSLYPFYISVREKILNWHQYKLESIDGPCLQ
jgi:hypothetical protein